MSTIRTNSPSVTAAQQSARAQRGRAAGRYPSQRRCLEHYSFLNLCYEIV